ncbi:MAG: YesL family protein [Lachnospiraceae bacterium]|nr:YesL family protein [Lachnospiraceae bacterium]
MKGVFGYEGKFFAFMDKVGSLFWLNLLTIICSIPVFTAGASITACYYVTLKMVRDEEGYITKSFFKSFKQNFRQSTVIWLITLLLGLVFFADYRLLNLKDANGGPVVPFSNFIFIVVGAVAIVCLLINIYVYPVLAKFDNTIKNTVKNAFFMSILNLPKTIMLVVINAIFPALFILPVTTGKALWLILVVLCFGVSANAYFCSLLFVGIFDKYISDEVPENRDEVITDRDTGSSK